MKRFLLFVVARILLAGATVFCFADDDGCDGLVSDVSHHYAVDASRVPMMGLVSLCARWKTHGGVKGLSVVEFHNINGSGDGSELALLVRDHLGSAWQTFVHEQEKGGGTQSLIFIREKGDAMRLIIADYNHGELDLVRMELSGDALAKWMRDPEGGTPR